MLRLLGAMVRWELLRMYKAQGARRRALFGLMLFIGWMILTAATLGWMFQWPLLVIILSVFPVVLMLGYLADSFAGERERGTLETLLLSPTPDWIIVCSKIIALVTITLLASMALLTVHALTARSFGIEGLAPRWYLLGWYAAAVVATITTCFGLIVSWSSTSVQAAQQNLAYGVVGFSIAVSVYTYLPASITRVLDRLNVAWIAWLGPALAIGTVVIAIGLFHRDRLLLR